MAQGRHKTSAQPLEYRNHGQPVRVLRCRGTPAHFTRKGTLLSVRRIRFCTTWEADSTSSIGRLSRTNLYPTPCSSACVLAVALSILLWPNSRLSNNGLGG